VADQTILIIRHAEKPDADGDSGVDSSGISDPKSLTPRGWQRAGAWAELFAPAFKENGVLPKPNALFASAPATHAELATAAGESKSRRPTETITPLATKSGLKIDLRFGKGNETDLAAALLEIEGVVLVCWQHENIAAIAQAISPTTRDIPTKWPGDRFNVIFSFTRPDSETPWTFRQFCPVMLAEDAADAI
jgi:hypothetical protein